jgi:flagellar hook-associated protein 2
MVGSIDGLASGLNTGQIISQLIQIERQGQLRLKRTQAQTENSITALQSLNTKFLAAKTATDPFTKATGTGWTAMSTSSSDPTRASATTTAGAAPGQVTFAIKQLAAAEVQKSAGTVGSTADVVATADFTITKDGTSTSIAVGDGKLSTVVKAINDAGAGVTATAVQISAGSYALQLTSTTTGDTLISVDGDPFAGSTLGTVGVVTEGKNAELQVGVAADGSGGYAVTRKTNTVTDLLAGTTINLLKQDPTVAVTVKTTGDSAAVADGVAKMVAEINAVLAEIAKTTSYDSTTKKAGILHAEGGVRSLRDQLTNAVTGSTTSTPGLVGVSVQRDGTVLFDRAKFLAAWEADPAGVEATLGKDGLAGRVAAVADAASRPKDAAGGTGILTGAIANRERTITGLKADILRWDQRLELREQRLVAQFTALEKALGAAQSQGQWLAGQIAGLPNYGG